MNDAGTDPEALLHGTYVQEADCYARAVRLAGDLAAACARDKENGRQGDKEKESSDSFSLSPCLPFSLSPAQSPSLGDRLRPILDLLDEIAVHEARIASAKQRWEQAGRYAGAELRGVMDRVASLIRELGNHLKAIEEAACKRRDRLAVELDACNRRRQMHRAYSRES